MKYKNKIFVTKPYLPPFEELEEGVRRIWATKELSNQGYYHKKFETNLSEFLDSPYVSLINNCTTALLIGFKVLNIKKEVLTTPYSFVATTSSLLWSNIKANFSDIDQENFNLDPALIENSLTEKTEAILATHTYGNCCQIDSIKEIARNKKLKLIYDGAAGLGSKIKGKSILNFGDLTTISFHATKLVNTFEGGAIISSNQELKDKIDKIKNFGINESEDIEEIGINGKLNEFSCLVGLHQLKHINHIIEKRKIIAKRYNHFLREIGDIIIPNFLENNEYNYSYYPIKIKGEGKHSRDNLYNHLTSNNIYPKKYFSKLLPNLSNAGSNNLKNAMNASKEILCLPIYPDLKENEQSYIIEKIKNFWK